MMCGDGNMGKYIMITTAFYIFVDGRELEKESMKKNECQSRWGSDLYILPSPALWHFSLLVFLCRMFVQIYLFRFCFLLCLCSIWWEKDAGEGNRWREICSVSERAVSYILCGGGGWV